MADPQYYASPREFAELGPWIQEKRRELFPSKAAAYRAADLAPQTWARLENGEVTWIDSLVAAIKILWPEAEGSPQAVLRIVNGQQPFPDEGDDEPVIVHADQYDDEEPPTAPDLSGVSDENLVLEILKRLSAAKSEITLLKMR